MGGICGSGLYIVILTPAFEGEQSAGTSPVPINQLSVFIAFPVLSALLQRLWPIQKSKARDVCPQTRSTWGTMYAAV